MRQHIDVINTQSVRERIVALLAAKPGTATAGSESTATAGSETTATTLRAANPQELKRSHSVTTDMEFLPCALHPTHAREDMPGAMQHDTVGLNTVRFERQVIFLITLVFKYGFTLSTVIYKFI